MSKYVTIKDAKIFFRNFKGAEARYNPKGVMNFCVHLDPELADELRKEGWNVKFSEKYEDYTQVAVSFKNVPPKIIMITSRGRTQLNENTVGMLDDVEIVKADITLNGHSWDEGRRVKGYLRSMYVTIFEDELDLEYAEDNRSEEDSELPF